MTERQSTGASISEPIERRNPLISYPFPVNDGQQIGNVRLPKFLTQEDADRLKAFVQTLVMGGDRGE